MVWEELMLVGTGSSALQIVPIGKGAEKTTVSWNS